MRVLADSSFVYALYNDSDSNHNLAAQFSSAYRGVILVPDAVLPEVCYLFERDKGYYGICQFLDNFRSVDTSLTPLEQSDISRMYEIATKYADARFDIVDCCIMALAERLDVRAIATFDRRDFSIYQPLHCEVLALKP